LINAMKMYARDLNQILNLMKISGYYNSKWIRLWISDVFHGLNERRSDKEDPVSLALTVGLCSILLFGLAGAAENAEQNWKTYRSEKFGKERRGRRILSIFLLQGWVGDFHPSLCPIRTWGFLKDVFDITRSKVHISTRITIKTRSFYYFNRGL